METITKTEVIQKIKAHITGCTISKNEYLKSELYNAAQDMQSRIDGLEIALGYVELINSVK